MNCKSLIKKPLKWLFSAPNSNKKGNLIEIREANLIRSKFGFFDATQVFKHCYRNYDKFFFYAFKHFWKSCTSRLGKSRESKSPYSFSFTLHSFSTKADLLTCQMASGEKGASPHWRFPWLNIFLGRDLSTFPFYWFFNKIVIIFFINYIFIY